MQNTTYRTGRMLGSGTYAIVREAIHIHTNQVYACKILSKQRMEGREYLVRCAILKCEEGRRRLGATQIRNEIAVLERISSRHPNIVTLHDYFESPRNMYLCFDLCTGGKLFDQICSKGHYYEPDAASLVRTILTAVKYIHGAGIVHRDLKPENLLFQTQAEDADIIITDFGLSCFMDDEKLTLLTEVCGTPGYMAPEIFFDSVDAAGYGKPVDVWAMGVITYFLLAGYTPFDRDTPEAEKQAIIAGDYAFAPVEYWANVSETARDFVQMCLTVDPARRPTAAEALEHRWLVSATPHFVTDPFSPTGGPADLLPHVKKALTAKRTRKLADFGIRAICERAKIQAGERVGAQTL
ncbi:Protein kinase domain-containing protein [Mycena sanguinolenta]|uniref:Protein kinase domain-containing protein n=1 Tax=Mycena sanguinolenta TaxID=230812 RepID=A0A8H6YU08_9AGAR|nr:Protein kinase domain-containing protein [Mycena sanguinolenta]